MKKLYVASAVLFLFAACSKDFLKSYENRIIGSWYISDVNRIGIGGNFDELPKRNINSEVIRTFQVTTVDFNTNEVRSEFYDDMNFRSTNHFVATINNSFRSFTTHFRR